MGALTVHEAVLGQQQRLGKGGMAVVYDLPDFHLADDPSGRWVYKKYKAKVRPISAYAMEQLVRHRENQEPKVRSALDRGFNWPRRAVQDEQDGASGVILPLIQKDYFLTMRLSSGELKTKPAEGQFLFQPREYCGRVGIPFATDLERRQLVRSLCYAFAVLERVNVVYGDLSALNFIWRLGNRPGVMLADCDSVRVTGERPPFGKQPHSPDWEPPEAKEAVRRRDSTGYSIQNLASDRYKLGLAILRVLTPGQGCAGRHDPREARQVLNTQLYTLLERSLSDEPGRRPAAREWYEEMTR
jgi:DNA-binding helix-hairpin-helix protein with protein kinase domain